MATTSTTRYREDLTGFSAPMFLVAYVVFPAAFSALVELGGGWKAWLLGAAIAEGLFGLPLLLQWGALGLRLTGDALTVGYPVLPSRLRIAPLAAVDLPLGAIESYEIVSGDDLKRRRRSMVGFVPARNRKGRRPVAARGRLAPAWARSALWVHLADGSPSYGSRPGDRIWVGYAPVPNPYTDSRNWLIPTRHPHRLDAALREAMAARGRPASPSPAGGVAPERPSDDDLWSQWQRRERSVGPSPHTTAP